MHRITAGARPNQLVPPLCGPPHLQPSPRTPRMGLVKGKILFNILSGNHNYCMINIYGSSITSVLVVHTDT